MVRIIAVVAVVWLIWSGMNAAVAKAKNRDHALCFLLSLVLSPPIVFLYLLAAPALAQPKPSILFGGRGVYVPTGADLTPQERRRQREATRGAAPSVTGRQGDAEALGHSDKKAGGAGDETASFHDDEAEDGYVPAEYQAQPIKGLPFLGDLWHLAPTAAKIGIAVVAVGLASVFGVRYAAEIDAFLLAPRNSDYTIHTAIRRHSATGSKWALRNVKRFVVKGQVQTPDIGGFTPLHTAAMEGDTEAIRVLLAHGADKYARCDSQFTPLHWAAREGQTDAARLLVEAGTNIEVPGFMGETPLLVAAKQGHMDTVQELLALGANPKTQNVNGNTVPEVLGAHINQMRRLGLMSQAEYDERRRIVETLQRTNRLGFRRRR